MRIAAGPDPETLLLSHVLAALLSHAGLPAEVISYADGRDARQAVELGAADLRVGYTGEAWLETLNRADPPPDPEASYLAVRDHDREEGLTWMRPTFGEDALDEPPANATFAFVVRPPAEEGDPDLRTMSQLAAHLSEDPDARVCVDREFGSRPDGLRAVLEAYSVRRDRSFLAASPEEAVLGVAAGDCLTGLTTTTDGLAWRAGLRPLVDDLKVFPAFVPLPQIRTEVQRERPRIGAALGPMPTQLTTALLGRWNAQVVDGQPLEEVAAAAAQELLIRAGRIADPDEDADA